MKSANRLKNHRDFHSTGKINSSFRSIDEALSPRVRVRGMTDILIKDKTNEAIRRLSSKK